MSYQVLARKWRPQRFSEVVGQQHVLSALENGLREDRLHHTYLFSGTRGVGKTSIARLFAKGLNCETGITATPCGTCANCKAIEEGRFIDLIEIDAASRTKVEDTRELLDNVQYKPTVGRFKVYLIDEVHMLSRHSFNALLKTLEEPPEYVKFLLATTDPQKLPITILSRCMQFHLRALETSQIRDHLAQILHHEQIAFEPLALEKLAKSANGSIRDALSLTDQAIAVSNANITLPIVQQMLGLIDDSEPAELLSALALADGEKALNVIDRVAQKGGDWQQFLSDLAENLHQIAMLQLRPQSHEQESALHALARQLSPEDVQFFYHLMLAGKKELPFAPEQRSGVEMVILRALAFHPKLAAQTPQVVPESPPTSPTVKAKATASAASHLAHIHQVLAKETPKSAASATREAGKNRENFTRPTPPPVEPLPEYIPLSYEMPQGDAPMPHHEAGKNQENFPRPETPSVSPALQAIQARAQLKTKRANLGVESEKKKSDLTEEGGLQNRLANLIHSPSTPNTKPAEPVENAQEEDYRWTWLNPELETEAQTTKPSDIKAAILQKSTPELAQKIIALSCERDRWSALTDSLKLAGMSRQLLLNSVLSAQNGDELVLQLRPAMAHLDTPPARQALGEALAKQGLRFNLSVGESAQPTPLELRRQIFEELTENARQALYADEKLTLLREAFGAEIDESTIRAVADAE